MTTDTPWPTIAEPRDQRLHVSEPVWRFWLGMYAKASRPGVPPSLADVPVVVDGKLTGSQWQLFKDGEVAQSGDMAPAPEGMTVYWSPHAGWIAIAPDLVTEWEEA